MNTANIEPSDFSLMEETVQQICHYLENEPHSWTIRSNTFYRIEEFSTFYYESTTERVTHVMSVSGTLHRVFSEEQGRRIWKSLQICIGKIGTEAQRAVAKEFSPLPKKETSSWWKELFE